MSDKRPDHIAQVMRDLSGRITRWQDTAPKLHKWMLLRIKQQIESQGQAEGTPWPALEQSEPRWAKLKAALGADPRPLRWEPGKRERLIPSLINARHPLHIWAARGDAYAFGTAVPYAGRHQNGTGTNPFGESIPKRPLVTLGDRSRGRLAQLMAIYIARGDTRGNRWDQ
jgi:phage gpG-like protein